MRDTDEAYGRLCDQLSDWSDRQGSSQFRELLTRLEAYAEAGSIDAAEFLAELLSHSGPNHDAEAAYKWHFVALSSQDYSTEFVDLNGMPPRYRGPTGDFRNEALVNDLVAELGFAKVRQLDLEVRQWLTRARG